MIGSDVHYVADVPYGRAESSELVAARVTQVRSVDLVSLKLFYPTAVEDRPSVPYSPFYRPGYWSLPSRSVAASELKLPQTSAGLISIRSAEVRTDLGMMPRVGARINFTYLGPSQNTIPLGSGDIRRQIGLRLRAANTCNLVYIMWYIDTKTGIHVSVKSNPGMTTHAQCRDGGYINIKPQTLRAVDPVQIGQSRVLSARIDNRVLTVKADGALAWQAPLPDVAFAFDGPVGVRSDNGNFDFDFEVLS